MRQHLNPTPASAETPSFELTDDPTEVSPGEALTLAQTEDRQWRHARRQQLSHWIRRVSRWGLMAKAASQVTGYGGLLLGAAALPIGLLLPPVATGLGVLAIVCLLSVPLLLAFAWLCYVALGFLTRWAKHEAILDELPTRRPLLWPGAPRPR